MAAHSTCQPKPASLAFALSLSYSCAKGYTACLGLRRPYAKWPLTRWTVAALALLPAPGIPEGCWPQYGGLGTMFSASRIQHPPPTVFQPAVSRAPVTIFQTCSITSPAGSPPWALIHDEQTSRRTARRTNQKPHFPLADE